MKNKSVSILLPRILPHLYILAVLALLICTAHIASGQQIARNFAPDSDRAAAESVSVASIERRVFDLVNAERVQHGLRPVVWVDRVAAVARFHSNNMVTGNFFSHIDPQGRRSGKRADQLGVRDWKQISENIAWVSGQDPAASVVRCWMQSPGHRENILDPASKESGIGLSIAPDGKYYFTQVFMVRK